MFSRLWLAFLLIVLASLPKIAFSDPVRNPTNGHYYELVTDNTDWDSANTAAALRSYVGLSGHLATVTSAEEEAFINSNFAGTTFWLGSIQAPGSAEPAGGIRMGDGRNLCLYRLE